MSLQPIPKRDRPTMILALRNVQLACCWSGILAGSMFLHCVAAAASARQVPASSPAETAQEEANVYNTDDLFSAKYDPIVETRAQGDPRSAFESVESLLRDLKQAREQSQPTVDGEERLKITLAIRANLLRDLNRNDESIEAHRELLELTRQGTDVAERLLHLEIRQNYATTLEQAGQGAQALAEKKKVLSEFEDLMRLHADNEVIKIQSTTAMNNYGISQIKNGQHREALATLRQGIDLLRGIEGENSHRDRKLATLLLNAGFAAAYVGDPSQARQYIEESLKLQDALGQLQTQEAIRARITLGAILGRLNQYREAAESYRLAVEQLRLLYPVDRYPDGTVDLAVALDNRSVSLVRLERLEEALEYAIEANKMFAALAQKSPGIRINFARSSANVALLNARLGNRAAAVGNLDVAIAAYEQMFPGGHAELPGLYRSKAIVLSELRREQESIDAAQKALALAQASFPAEVYPHGHSVLARALDTAGVICLAAGEPESAAGYFERAFKMQSALAEQTLQFISEAESLQFLAVLDTFKSHLLSVSLPATTTYELLVADKARILDQQKRRLLVTRQAKDPEVAELAARYQQVRTVLARQALAPNAGPEAAQQVAQLQVMREDLERQIAEIAAKSSAQAVSEITSPVLTAGPDRVDLRDQLASLPADMCVVEFFSYEHFSIDETGGHRRTTGRQQISAFVLRGSDHQIRRIEIGPALDLRRDVRRLVVAMPFGTEQEPLQTVSRTVGEPLCEALSAECRQLVVIPDGIMSGVPYACLIKPGTDQPLVKEMQLTIQSSLQGLAAPSRRIEPRANVVAVGGVDYGAAAAAQPLTFSDLPGTALELQVLQRKFDEGRVKMLGGVNATEAQLFELLPAAQVVHLATHAYVTDFARNAVTNNDLTTGAVRISADQRSPLLAARVALSGANGWSENPTSIVTGERFAAADLRETQLVVLSACESGVGERVVGEGVFGLPRAFHIAGATDVLATLWPVSDDDAVAFMERFYHFLLQEQLTPAAALRQAQLAMLEQSTGSGADARPTRMRGIKFDIPGEEGEQSEGDEAPNRDVNRLAPTARSTWAAFFLSRG